jgi:predicted DNA-binding ribbon-helix-helix protein
VKQKPLAFTQLRDCGFSDGGAEGLGMKTNRLVVKKRSIVVAERKTSVSLEEPFWVSLKEIAASKNVTMRDLIASIRAEGAANLSSAIRLFVLDHYRSIDTCRLRSRPDVAIELKANAQATTSTLEA